MDDRFWAKVEKTQGCWIWTGAKTRDGYGSVKRFGRSFLAHRVAYEAEIGPIPKGLELDHGCRNPPCVNPEHLEPVTHRENLRRGVQSGLKTHCPQGHPWIPRNIYITPGGPERGARRCLPCKRARGRARYARKRLESGA